MVSREKPSIYPEESLIMGMGGGEVNYNVLIKVTSSTAQAPPLIKECLETQRAVPH